MNQSLTKHKIRFRFNGRNAAYWLFLVLMTFPHLEPPYLDTFPILETAFTLMKAATFLVMLFWFFLSRRRIPYVILLTAVWRSVFVLSTILHDGQIYASIASSFSVLSVMLLYELAYTRENATFLSAQLFCFELVIYINLVTVILFPGGLYSDGSYLFIHQKNWFLGYYNGYTLYCVPALMFAWLYKYKTGDKFRTYALSLAIVITAVKMWSGGVLMALLAMAIVYTFFKNRTSLFNYYSYWLLHVVFLIAIFALRIQNLFSWLIGDFLGKMTSLLFRIDIWEKTIELFWQSPIIGHGMQISFTRAAEYHQNHGIHAHNMLLEVLYQNGIVGMCLWIGVIILAGRCIYQYRNTMESKIIATAFLGWCIATLVEPFTSSFLMGMFVIAYHSNRGERSARNRTSFVNGHAVRRIAREGN